MSDYVQELKKNQLDVFRLLEKIISHFHRIFWYSFWEKLILSNSCDLSRWDFFLKPTSLTRDWLALLTTTTFTTFNLPQLEVTRWSKFAKGWSELPDSIGTEKSRKELISLPEQTIGPTLFSNPSLISKKILSQDFLKRSSPVNRRSPMQLKIISSIPIPWSSFSANSLLT